MGSRDVGRHQDGETGADFQVNCIAETIAQQMLHEQQRQEITLKITQAKRCVRLHSTLNTVTTDALQALDKMRGAFGHSAIVI